MSRIIRTAAALGALSVAVLGLGACSSDGGSQAEAAENGAQTLLVATGAQPKPYTYLDENDELTGYDIEILRLVAQLQGRD